MTKHNHHCLSFSPIYFVGMLGNLSCIRFVSPSPTVPQVPESCWKARRQCSRKPPFSTSIVVSARLELIIDDCNLQEQCFSTFPMARTRCTSNLAILFGTNVLPRSDKIDSPTPISRFHQSGPTFNDFAANHGQPLYTIGNPIFARDLGNAFWHQVVTGVRTIVSV